jgi:hypothetical protein
MLEDPFMLNSNKGLGKVLRVTKRECLVFYVTDIIFLYYAVEMFAANSRNSVSLSTRTDCLLWKV